jgi:mannose-6-phosphate isomerase-like protein (cupin superfamily)
MNGYTSNIMDETLDNTNFRKVLYTGKHMQLVVMSLKPGEDIGEEVHDHVDQFFRIEEGECKVIIDGEETLLTDDMVAIVPAGSRHNVINTSESEDLKLYTIYSPANHPEGTIHATREEAMKAEEEEHNH